MPKNTSDKLSYTNKLSENEETKLLKNSSDESSNSHTTMEKDNTAATTPMHDEPPPSEDAPMIGGSSLFNNSGGAPLLQPYTDSLSAIPTLTDPMLDTSQTMSTDSGSSPETSSSEMSSGRSAEISSEVSPSGTLGESPISDVSSAAASTLPEKSSSNTESFSVVDSSKIGGIYFTFYFSLYV